MAESKLTDEQMTSTSQGVVTLIQEVKCSQADYVELLAHVIDDLETEKAAAEEDVPA